MNAASSRALRSAIQVQHTATSDVAWDGPANEANLKLGQPEDYYHRAYAWQDPDKDPTTKADYRFLHHLVSADGAIGAASLRACSAGIAVLNGARGGTTIPNADVPGVHQHLAAHMHDANMEPPALMRAAPAGPERRSLSLVELRADPGADGGPLKLTWYASVFDTLSEDLGGFREKVARRAFAATLKADDVRALFNHNPDYLLGRTSAGTLRLKADAKGLLAEVDLPDTQLVRDLVVSAVERGDLTSGSFAFEIQDDKWADGGPDGVVRELRTVKLYDVSLATFPAYPAADGASIRSLLAPLHPERLAASLARARAGMLGAEDVDEINLAMRSLGELLPAPQAPAEAPQGAPVDYAALAGIRRRRLDLLRLAI